MLDGTLADFKILVDAARDDHEQQRFESYENYIAEFNRLIGEIEADIGDTGIGTIASVADGDLSMMGAGFGTNPEKAKLREVVSKCDRLMARLSSSDETTAQVDGIDHVKQVCNRFHTIARQLQSRYSDRTTIEINDEYDVQDLFHGPVSYTHLTLPTIYSV